MLLALLQAEAGKTLDDALAEVREAVDFLRYYAAEAVRLFAPQRLPGPTGEENRLILRGRGPFVCIAPWNFPLAIFVGQAAAALVAGDSVVAKPAPQTPLIACEAVRLLHEAGVPASALQFVPGGARQARRSSRIRRRPASPSPARPRPRAPSTGRWRPRTDRSCRSSPRRAGSTP